MLNIRTSDARVKAESDGAKAFFAENYGRAAEYFLREGRNTNNATALNNKIASFNFFRYKGVVEGNKRFLKLLTKFSEWEIVGCLEKLAVLSDGLTDERVFLTLAQYYSIDLKLYCEEVLLLLENAPSTARVNFLRGMAYSNSQNPKALDCFAKVGDEHREIKEISRLCAIEMYLKTSPDKAKAELKALKNSINIVENGEYYMKLLSDAEMFKDIIALYEKSKGEIQKMSPFHFYFYALSLVYSDRVDDAYVEYAELKSSGLYNRYLGKMLDYYYYKAKEQEKLLVAEQPFLVLPYFDSIIG